MVAVAMNGVPLPARHGFPARLLVPGLYGYVSATKWLSSIELWRLGRVRRLLDPARLVEERADQDASRASTCPSRATRWQPGTQTIAGVAWAPTRGIERVEVQIDDGPWQQATLAEALGVDTWRQWLLRWDATPGKHTIAVRATDGTGDTQTSERERPAAGRRDGVPHDRVSVG